MGFDYDKEKKEFIAGNTTVAVTEFPLISRIEQKPQKTV